MIRLVLVLLSLVPAPSYAQAGALRSGYQDMSPATRAIQDDDAANPGMLWVLEGEALWKRRAAGGMSCDDCHDAARMKGVAARHPAYDAAAGRVLTLEQKINACRATRQGEKPLAYESRELLSLAAFVGRESRGMPVAVEKNERNRSTIENGERLFRTRHGQLDLACVHCHDERAGKKLAGNVIPQGHPNGYPLYRLEWQALGSLQRRMRGCLTGVRAEPYAFGSPEFTELEAYLAWRARGMKVETPAVRP